MSTDNKNPVELDISEEQDGSAVVALPENMVMDDQEEQKDKKLRCTL